MNLENELHQVTEPTSYYGIHTALWQRYELLSNLRAPQEVYKHPKDTYGHGDFVGFLQSFVERIEETGYAELHLVNESLSGKSWVARQTAGFLSELGVKVIYVPWVDTIKAAKKKGIVAETTDFGDFSKREFSDLTKFYEHQFEEIDRKVEFLRKQTPEAKYAVIGEVVGVPSYVVDKNERLLALNRGLTAVKHRVKKGAYVQAISGTPSQTTKAERDRTNAHKLSGDEEEADQFSEEHAINPHFSSLRQMAVEVSKSGAPVVSVKKQKEQIDRAVIVFSRVGNYSLPKAVQRPEDIVTNTSLRSRIMKQHFLPYVLRNVLQVPEERAFISINTKVRSRIKFYPLDQINHLKRVYGLI